MLRRSILPAALGAACLLPACAPAAGPGAEKTAPAQAIHPRDAARHEGQTVAVEGVATSVQVWGDAWRVDVARDGDALPVVLEGDAPGLGSWLYAEGRLRRQGGSLVLDAERTSDVPPPAPATPSWDALAADPEGWQETWLRLDGTVERGELRDGAGHALHLGDGPWPREGAVTAWGVLAWDGGCLCHRLHASRVAPWTS